MKETLKAIGGLCIIMFLILPIFAVWGCDALLIIKIEATLIIIITLIFILTWKDDEIDIKAERKSFAERLKEKKDERESQL